MDWFPALESRMVQRQFSSSVPLSIANFRWISGGSDNLNGALADPAAPTWLPKPGTR